MKTKTSAKVSATFVFGDALKRLEENNDAYAKAMKSTTNDLRKRLPGKVADDVRTRYNIKKSEITPAKTGKGRRVTTIKVKGEKVSELTLIYRGRRLTHTHFGLLPKSLPAPKNLPEKGPGARKHRRLKGGDRADLRKRRKKLTAKVLKGGRKVIHSQAFLVKTKGEGGGQYLPFVRDGKKALPIKALKTVSVPQMIDHPRVRPLIEQDTNDLLMKRLAHNVKRFKKE